VQQVHLPGKSKRGNDTMNFGAKFEEGLSYQDFLAKYGSEEHQRRWKGVHDEVQLTGAQKELLRSFKREMKVLVVAGAWCGDCVNQCPIFDHFAAENAQIRIHFFDRDEQAELAGELALCGAPRVPSVLFLSEDNFVCGRYGDRTLSKYRQMTQDKLGAACPTGIVPPEQTLLESVVEDWLDEFERIQLMLRTSGRLRELHGD
jgi:thiol-disulfide isomerase/thioredoxin